MSRNYDYMIDILTRRRQVRCSVLAFEAETSATPKELVMHSNIAT